MVPTLARFAESRDNNYNLIRLVAAAAVLVGHCYPLTRGDGARDPLESAIGLSLGELAVDVFFVISGFLVTRSLEARGNVGRFAMARVLRIYPAAIAAALVCAFGLGLAFTRLGAWDFLGSSEIYGFVLRNATFLRSPAFELPGVFEGNPYPLAVNGSLWTLPWEIRMYLSLAGLALAPKLVGLRIGTAVLWIAAAALAARTACTLVGADLPGNVNDGLRFLSIFYLGGLCHVLRERISLRTPIFLLLLACLALAAPFAPTLFRVMYQLALPYLVLFLAYVPAGFIRRYNRLGDYSYGTYIYAFPIQQSVAATLGAPGPLQMLAVALPLTLLFAVVSWHLVEKPALDWKRG